MADSQREQVLEDAFRNIIFQQIQKGDSLDEQRRKSQENAFAVIACELDEIRKLMKEPQHELKMTQSEGDVEYQRLIHRYQCNCGRQFDPFDESDCKDLAAMQRLVGLLKSNKLRIYSDGDTTSVVIFSDTTSGKPVWDSDSGESFTDAILAIPKEE